MGLLCTENIVRIVGRDTIILSYYLFFVKITGKGKKAVFHSNLNKSWEQPDIEQQPSVTMVFA